MGGLYNILFGQNPQAEVILATLGLTKEDMGRFRDCFVAHGEIAVYTRNGGNNRHCVQDYENGGWPDGPAETDCGQTGCYGCIISHRLPQHPCYLRDSDDDFDTTYATVYFRFPEEFAEGLQALDQGQPFDPDARWQQLFAALDQMKAPQP